MSDSPTSETATRGAALPPLEVVLVSAAPAARNGRHGLMAGTLARAGCRVTLITEPGAAPSPPPEGVRVLEALPPGVDRGGRSEAPAGEALDALRAADVAHVAGQGGVAWALKALGPDTALIYDAPATFPRPTPARGCWPAPGP